MPSMQSTADDKATPPLAPAVAKALPRNDDTDGSASKAAPGRDTAASARNQDAIRTQARMAAGYAFPPSGLAVGVAVTLMATSGLQAVAAAAAQRQSPATDPNVALAMGQNQQTNAPSAPRLPTNPPPAATGKKKRGRPEGSTDSKPRKKAAEKTPKQQKLPQYASVADKRKVEAAKKKIADGHRRHMLATKKVEKAEAEVAKAQALLDKAKLLAEKASGDITATAAEFANDLLLEPIPWNDFYQLLVRFKEREGHIRIQRVDGPGSFPVYNGLTPEGQKEYRTLSWWMGRQRTARNKGLLERHQQLLLDRLGFNWKPTQGPGPEKWQAKFESLKEYQRIHGDCRVPKDYQGARTLSGWVQTQKHEYRNAKAGKKPALAEERIRLLEEIGFDWGAPRVYTPWETRFEELCRYREEFGNANVPWRWKRNRPLAGWVNSERNKYKALMDGKKAPITAEQIQKLNGIGFQWNAGGNGRYVNEPKVGWASGQVGRLEQGHDLGDMYE